jgi:hypothetical protein
MSPDEVSAIMLHGSWATLVGPLRAAVVRRNPRSLAVRRVSHAAT